MDLIIIRKTHDDANFLRQFTVDETLVKRIVGNHSSEISQIVETQVQKRTLAPSNQQL
jgi:hypothetical protein